MEGFPMTYVKRCPECGSVNLTYDSQNGEIICNECGLIIEEKIVDTGQESGGQFDKSEKRGRGGAPISMQKYDKGLTTRGRLWQGFIIPSKDKLMSLLSGIAL